MKVARCLTLLSISSIIVPLGAQAPKEIFKKLPSLPDTKVVTIPYTNPFDNSQGEAMVELPKNVDRPVPLILTPHAANWTQEENRCLWTGVADRFGVIILYPRHQGRMNPRLSLGSEKQLANLEAAIAEVEKRYPVDRSRVYVAGLSQGAIETLLMAGHHPKQFAAALSINPVADMLAFYEDISPTAAEQTPDPGLRKLRETQWQGLRKLWEFEFGGTPETARANYYLRSPVLYSQDLASLPLTLFWGEDDELIPNGETHQGHMLSELIRSFHPARFKEVKHTGGHGYPFYQVDLDHMAIKWFPRDIFINAVADMLQEKSPQP